MVMGSGVDVHTSTLPWFTCFKAVLLKFTAPLCGISVLFTISAISHQPQFRQLALNEGKLLHAGKQAHFLRGFARGGVVLLKALFGNFGGHGVAVKGRHPGAVRRLNVHAGHGRAVFPELQPALDNISYLAKRLKDDLNEVSRTLTLRDDFVANASHELRSPLTSVMGFAEMLDEGMADSPEECELCVRMIRSECQRMLDVIEDILHLSRAGGKPVEEPQNVNVGNIAREIATSLSAQAAQKGIAISVEGDMVRMGVERDFWEMLYNLAGNAVRYGREDGHVWVRLSEDAIEVEDDGVGIAPDQLPKIWERFYQVDPARSGESSGLGLSMVRWIVQAHGGTIQAESALGEGSAFTARLPLGGPEGK